MTNYGHRGCWIGSKVLVILGMALYGAWGTEDAIGSTINVSRTAGVSGFVADSNTAPGALDGLGDSGGGNIDAREWSSTGNPNSNTLRRAILHFTLPAIPSGEAFQSATITLPVELWGGLHGYDVGLYHSVTQNQNFRNKALYEDGSFSRVGLVIADTQVNQVGNSFVLDVSAAIQAEYDEASFNANTWFMLPLEPAGTGAAAINVDSDEVNEYVRFSGTGTMLTLNYSAPVPEPTSFAFIVLGGVGILVQQRRI